MPSSPRFAFVALLSVLAAACTTGTTAPSASPAPSAQPSSAAPAASPSPSADACAKETLPALLRGERGRQQDRSVGTGRSDQRKGLRIGRLLCHRRAARVREGGSRLD